MYTSKSEAEGSLKEYIDDVNEAFKLGHMDAPYEDDCKIVKLGIMKVLFEGTEEQIEELKEKHEAIRTVLMDNGCEEYGDCIIDEICGIVGILPTTVYYIEGESEGSRDESE